MSITVKLRRGTTTQHSTFTGGEAEVTVDTTKDVVVVHDGVTVGGHPMAKASDLATVAFSGDYNDLSNLPSGTLLTTTDIGVTVQAYSANTVIDASYVHTDNNYTTTEKSKLAGIAAGAEVNVNADWTAGSGDAQILNKPTVVSAFTNDAGYLTSYTETDPVYTASSWYTTTNNSANWDTAYGWGNHASAGYLTSYTETDPIVGAVNGLVKANGAGTIAAAVAGTDYLAPAAIANMLETSDIGVTVQGYSAVLAGTTASFTTADETKLDGIEAGADVTDAANVEPLVNAHLNTSTAASGEVLSWNGTDYDWITPPAGYSDSSVDAHLNTSTATSGQVLGWTGTDYDWVDQSGGGGGGALTISNKTAAYTVVAGDLGTIINCTSGTFTVSLTAAATLGAGFNCWIWNTSATSTHAITIDPSGAETIDGSTTLILRRGEGMQIVCDGTNFQTGDKKVMRAYAENIGQGESRPIASGNNSISLGAGATSSGSASVSYGYFTRAGGNNSSALGYNANSSGLGSVALGSSPTSSGTNALAIGTSTTASSDNSTALGRNSAIQGSQAVTGSGAMALGGSYASGTDSFAAAVANNTSSYGATGANSIAIGSLAKASGASAVAIGPRASATGGSSLSICNSRANYGNASSGIGAITIGDGNAASQSVSAALGYGANSAVAGKYAWAAGSFADGNAEGSAQVGTLVLRVATTDATATVLRSNNSAATTTNQVILPNNSAYAFTGTVVAKQSGSTNAAAWKVEGLIVRGASAASTTLVFSTVMAISNLPLWTLALSADTTNGGLAVTATGAAATNIRWVATIQTSEVTYA